MPHVIKLSVLAYYLVSIHAFRIETVSDKNVTKRTDSFHDFYPDWVPFKNKKGAQLGDFVPVKKRPVKRLALPANFVLKRSADAEGGDDYYEKGQGDGDSDDYFEKKDWSDQNRPGNSGNVKNIIPETLGVNATAVEVDNIVVNVGNSKQSLPKASDSLEPTKADSSFSSPQQRGPRNEFNDYEDTKKIEYKEESSKPNTKDIEFKEENIKPSGNDEQETDLRDKESMETTTVKIPEPTTTDRMARLYLEAEEERQEELSREQEESKTTPKPNKDKNQSKEYSDYDDESAEKSKPQKPEQTEEEKKEAEERKRKILSQVDDLKRRHQKEAYEISERAKEDEIFIEERERDMSRSRLYRPTEADSYNIVNKYDKYNVHDKDPPKIVYDEYEDMNVNDKYKINPPTKKPEPTTPTTTTKRTPRTTTITQPTTPKRNGSTISSVFKNPNLYLMYNDYDSGEQTTEAGKRRKPVKYSSKVQDTVTPRVTTLHDPNETRTSPITENNEVRDGEPTLFFPKKRKNKRKRKNKNRSAVSMTDVPDSFVAESVPGVESKDDARTTASGTGTGPSAPNSASGPSASGPSGFAATGNARSAEETSGVGIDPTGLASGPEYHSTSVAPDVIAAASGHKEPPKDHHYEKGGAKEHFAEHEEEHGEHGKKAYEDIEEILLKVRREQLDQDEDDKPVPWYYAHMKGGVHEDAKTEKGHHDKESHHGSYDDHGGHDKEHMTESDHYGDHHHLEHGKKHAKYEESGKHSKGHSTKGSHDIHKKEEYEKKVEFFEEDGDSTEEEKLGGHTHKRAHSSVGKFKAVKLGDGYHELAKGDEGHFEKGGHLLRNKGHKSAAGHDSHGKHRANHFHDHGHGSGKQWIYHHGSPARNAKLAVIDRREDHMFHGPSYFG